MRIGVPVLLIISVVFSSPNAAGQQSQPSGLFPIQQNGKWGFINKEGRIVIRPQFDNVVQSNYHTIDQLTAQESFPEGLAPVNIGAKRNRFGLVSGGKWGYIDTTGKFIIRPRFITAYPFVDGMAAVSIQDLSPELRGLLITMNGYIDKTGRFIIPPRPYPFSLGPFADGLAPVETGSGGKTLYGYVNKTGRTVIAARFDYAGSFFEGLALVKMDAAWGYINKTGDIVIKLQYDLAGNFYNGLAPVMLNGRLNFINRNGEIQFDVPGASSDYLGILSIAFFEGLAPIKVGDRYGYVNLDGRFAIQPKFIFAWRFSEGLANVVVATKDGLLHGYINHSGAFVIAPKFASAMPFYNGLARVRVGNPFFGRMGYINRTRYIWKPSD